MLWTDSDGSRHRVGAFSQTHVLWYLTGAPASGYCETYDLNFIDGAERHVSEAQPHILCTDSPTMRIGTRQAIDDAIAYTADTTRDSFSRRCTWDPMPAGRFVRARLTSAAATALQGATLYAETGGMT